MKVHDAHAASSAGSPSTCHSGAVPKHIAIIMDGNSRWAKQKKLPSIAGHRAGAEAIRKVMRACHQHNVEVLTLFAFSSENWSRPETEVSALMRLFLNYLQKEVGVLHKENVRLRFIGRRDRLSDVIVQHMERAERLTESNRGRTLVLAVDYGGRWDITNAVNRMRQGGGDIDSVIDESTLSQYMALGDLPPADLCIRTGGEYRISNFLLWQIAYAELYFCDIFWPDFDEATLAQAIDAFGARQRRFGGRVDTPTNADRGDHA